MYGITQFDKEKIDKKIEKQKNFLKLLNFEIDGENIDMLENTYSANINPDKYFSEVNNRVNSIFTYAKNLDLMPIFLTFTAPSEFHKKDRYGKLINDIHDTSLHLSQVWQSFLRINLFKKIKKDIGHGLVYFRVYEPHKSGVPHCHVMAFIPKDYILELKKKFYEYFTDKGNNKKSIDFRYTWSNGIKGAISYMMKYILKSFKKPEDEELSDEVYWFIKHKIRRFNTSRTLAPLLLYRKIRYIYKEYEDDYIKLTKDYRYGKIIRNFNDTTITLQKLDDNLELVEDIIYNKHIDDENQLKNINFINKNRVYLHKKIKRKFGEEFANLHFNIDDILEIEAIRNGEFETEDIEEVINDIIIGKEFESQLYKEKMIVEENDEDYDDYYEDFANDESKCTYIQYCRPYLLNNYQLAIYFRSLMFHKYVNLHHFYVVKKEILKRGLIKDELISPDLF